MGEPVDPNVPEPAQTPWPPPPPGYGYPPLAYPPPPAPRNRRPLWIGLGVAVIVTASVIGSVLFVRHKATSLRGPRRDITAPSSFAQYRKLTGPDAQDIIARVRERGRSSGPDSARYYQTALIALYTTGTSASPQLIFISQNAAVERSSRPEFAYGSPKENARAFLRGAKVSALHEYAAGPLGGTIMCGYVVASARELPACLWMDQSTYGFVLDYTGTTPARLADAMLTLRTAAEH